MTFGSRLHSRVKGDPGNVVSLSFRVKDVPPEGTRVACFVGKEDLQLDENDPGIQDVLALTATIQAGEANFLVEGELDGLLLHECVRCLETFTASADLSFRTVYQDPGRQRSKEAEAGHGDSRAEETDYHSVVEQRIELQEMLREQLILSIPMQPLCSEGCQGLCQMCGQNLNVQKCECKEVKTESSFTILQAAFKQSQNPLA